MRAAGGNGNIHILLGAPAVPEHLICVRAPFSLTPSLPPPSLPLSLSYSFPQRSSTRRGMSRGKQRLRGWDALF